MFMQGCSWGGDVHVCYLQGIKSNYCSRLNYLENLVEGTVKLTNVSEKSLSHKYNTIFKEDFQS